MQKLLIRYTLDAMYCDMNLAKNFLKTIVGMKDTIKVRQDLQQKNIRKYLWLAQNPRRGQNMLKSAASYVLNDNVFKVFVSTIKNLKTSIGQSSNLGKHIYQKCGGLKSHNYHIYMQQLLPLGLKGFLQPRPRMAVMRMSKVYRRICTKIYNPTKFESLQANVARNMVLLEHGLYEILP